MRALTLAGMLAALLCVAASPGLNLEQALSAPFISGLTASPGGDRLAWVVNRNGVRNIWIAEAPFFRGRPLTGYTEDDGMEISSLAWSPEGSALAFVRGGAPGKEGNYPNPLSRPEGGEQAVWVIRPAGGAPQRIDEGASPAISSRGRLAYLKKGQVWAAGLSADPQPARLFSARGECRSLVWSPDGNALAFVSVRGDHSFIGVFDLSSNSIRYLDPGVDRDDFPVWSPDSKRVAFVRIPYARELLLFGPKRSAEPWSIRVAEAAGGAGRELWRAESGRGSVFHPLAGDKQIFWAAGSRIVFPWERDGWKHLYAMTAAGGIPIQLTSGNFEVETATLSLDSRSIIYASNRADLDGRSIWMTPVAGGVTSRLTANRSIEHSPVALSDGAAWLAATAREPARPFVLLGGSLIDAAPQSLPAAFPKQDLVEPELVAFRSADGMEIRGQLFTAGPAAAPRPAVIYLHGGSRRQMLRGWHPMEYYHQAYAFNQYLAARGFVVLSVNFRSGTGYGLEFREALHYGAVGASELQDVLAAADYLAGRKDVDRSRIGLWGGSYGGYLVALALARFSERFAAGVDLHGVHDWRTETRLYLDSDDVSVQQEALRLAFRSSPLAYVEQWSSPVFLIHGDDDPEVEFRQTVQLAEALRRRNVPFEQLVFADEGHGFLVHAHWLEAFRRASDFLEKYLKK